MTGIKIRREVEFRSSGNKQTFKTGAAALSRKPGNQIRNFSAIIRIGEGLTTFALLHHRAYGSVHGGSCSLT
jgi:hypothetical protein